MEHLKLESATDSPEFWNDAYAISSYCNSLLGATGKSEDVVSIYIEDYDGRPRVGYRRDEGKNKYSIYLPKIKDFYSNDDLLDSDIKLRKAFLKHEVAHIIYSDMESYNEHHKGDTSDIMFLNNAIEDVRVEWAFGKRFQGANDTFFEIQRKFFNRGKSKIEIDSPNLKNLAFYFMYRSKNFEFQKTLATEIYDKIFSKYSDFLNLSREEVSRLIREISKEFNSEVDSRKDEIKDYKDYLDETYPKQELEENDYRDDNGEETGESNEGDNYNPNATVNSKDQKPSPSYSNPNDQKDENESPESESPESNEEQDTSENNSGSSGSESGEENEGDDSESSEDSEDSEDSESSEEDEDDWDSEEDEDEEELDSEEDEGDDRDFNPDDFSSMLVDELQQNLDEELEDFDNKSNDNKTSSSEKFNKELENFVETVKDEVTGSDTEVVDMMKMIKGLEYDLIERLTTSNETLNEFVKYNNSKMKNLGSRVIDASRFLSLSNKKKKTKKKDTSINRSLYSKIVASNNKNIISLTNYFKLKFQDKEKSKRFYNKEEGDLHNESLYKILNRSQLDSRIFSRLEKSLVTKDDVSFLLDFSGSMEGYKLKNLLESLVVLNEVFSKIEIPYNVFSFSGMDHTYLDYKFNSLSEKIALQKMYNSKLFIQEKSYSDKDSICFRVIDQFKSKNFKLIYCLINRSTRPEERKKIIELLLRSASGDKSFKSWNKFFGGSTPECQAVIGLYNTLPKQKLFIINDGEYDSIDFHSKEINLIKQKQDEKLSTYLTFYNYLYDFLNGKEIILKNQDDEKVFKTFIDVAYSIFSKNLRYSNLMKFFEQKGNLTEQQKLNDVCVQIESVFASLNSCFYYIGNKNEHENIFFKIERRYFQKKDISHIVLTRKTLPSFTLKVITKIIPISEVYDTYYSNMRGITKSFFLDRDVIDNYNDLFRFCFFFNFNNFFEKAYITFKDEYTYKDLFNKMRSSNWEIYGIGIGNNTPEAYIGKENFTYIKDAVDIRNNLEKKIKKIV